MTPIICFSHRFLSFVLLSLMLSTAGWGQSTNTSFPPPPLEDEPYQEWITAQRDLFPAALKALEKELKANPSNVQLHYQLGIVLMGLGDYAKAYDQFAKFAQANIKEDLVWFYLARCSNGAGQHRNAITLYKKFSDLRPTDPTPLLEIVDVLIASQDKPQALQVSEQVAQSFPKSLAAQTKYASLIRPDRPAEAIKLYQDIGKKWPGAVEPQRAIISIYLSEKRISEALTLAQDVVQRFPQSQVAWEGLASVLQRQQQWAEAFKALSKALQLAKSPVSLTSDFMDLGFDAMRARDYSMAEQAYQQALQTDPVSDYAMYQLGRARVLNGKRKEAEEVQKSLKKLNHDLAKQLAKDISQPAKIEQEFAAVCVMDPKQLEGPSPGSLRPKVISQEKAKYTDLARSERIQGTIVVSVVFTADGRVTSPRIVRGLPYGLNDEAVKAVRKIRFRPACREGRPVSVRMGIEFTFNVF